MRKLLACLPRPLAPLFVRAGFVVVALVSSGAICTAAILAPTPASALPAVVALAVALSMLAGWELRPVAAALRHAAKERRELSGLEHELAALPETRHPLGL